MSSGALMLGGQDNFIQIPEETLTCRCATGTMSRWLATGQAGMGRMQSRQARWWINQHDRE